MKDLNTDFLLNIWAELKAKRLAPVAVALVVALVAMPALLLKGDEGAAEEPLPILASSPDTGAEVEVAEELAERGSKLDSYKARDPFKGRIRPSAEEPEVGGTAVVPSAGALAGGTPEKTAGGSIGSLGGLGSAGSGGAGGLGDDARDGPADSGGKPPRIVVRPRRYRFNYQLDVRVGRPGQEQRRRNVSRLTFLPRRSMPALLFMGVPVKAQTALFFVYPGLAHQGDGDCVPNRKHCNFLELEVGDRHYLSANDREFRITLLAIKRVKLRKEKKQRAAARKAERRRSERTGGDESAPGTGPVAGEPAEVLPWLVDAIG